MRKAYLVSWGCDNLYYHSDLVATFKLASKLAKTWRKNGNNLQKQSGLPEVKRWKAVYKNAKGRRFLQRWYGGFKQDTFIEIKEFEILNKVKNESA